VAATVDAVNLVSPGAAGGRPYVPPTGTSLGDQLVAALEPARQVEAQPSTGEIAELVGHLASVRRVFQLADDLDAACVHVNELLSATNAIPVLSRHGGNTWHLHFHAPDASWAMGWAGGMFAALAVVLGSPAHDRLGVCSAPACDRVYVDTSRNGTRRFCSTACQNRVKAAVFRERQRAATGP
jgi:predicted RNA-binding Zn ribbon-like protein